ncbi:MAG: BACON domain-containing carbohydrate-binding protein [Prevotellaceae bacterium]|nr:BACON domain-containing carbohydrate-binding protein [Prevotellaceae bacterium]
MKLKYFVPMFIMALAMLTSCSDDEVVTYPDGLRVSSSYMALPVDGGTATITVNCNQKWSVDTVGAFAKKTPWFDYKIIEEKDSLPKIQLSADATLDGRSTSFKIVAENGTTQIVNVMQGLSTVSTATCAEVIAGPDSKTYQVKGTCTAIANTTYGNWYLNDGTGEIYIYGTLDKDGKEKNFLSLGLEVGDEVVVQGPKTTYGSTIELVNVTVVAINKSLIKVDSTYVGDVASNELPLEGGEITAYVTCKGQGVTVDIPEDAKDWLSIAAIKNGGSEVVFKAAPNAGGDRNTTVIFRTTDGKKEYTSQMTVAQKGAIVPVTCAEFNAKPVGDAQYRIYGLVTKVANTKYGNIYVQDYSGEVYVYGTTNYSDFPVKEGDVVNIVGPHAEYNGNPQMKNATIEELCASAEPISLADFNAAENSNDKFYVLTGKIVKIENDKYGNVYIEDETGEKVYLYGVYGDWTGENKQYFIKDNGIAVGDTITVVTIKTSHNDSPQGKNAVCFGVVKAE